MSKLNAATGPGAMDKPAFATVKEAPTAVDLNDSSIRDLKAGMFDSLFEHADPRPSVLLEASLKPVPQPEVELVSAIPWKPLRFQLPKLSSYCQGSQHRG